MIFDVTTIYKAKIGEIHVEEDENYMRAEGCVMQEMFLTWEQRTKMRDDDGPTLPLQIFGSVELQKEGTALKVTCDRRRGYDWHVKELIAACYLSLDEFPDFFKGLQDVEVVLEDNNPYDEIEDDLVFPKKLRKAEGPQCIPRAKVMERRARDAAVEEDEDMEGYDQAYAAVLAMLCEPPEESMEDEEDSCPSQI
jgi:hypothetical protein